MEPLIYFFDLNNHNQIEITLQVAKMSGKLAYKFNQAGIL